MSAAEKKAIKHCQKNNLIIPFFSKKANKVISEAINIALKEQAKQDYEVVREWLQRFKKNEYTIEQVKRNIHKYFKKKWLGGKE